MVAIAVETTAEVAAAMGQTTEQVTVREKKKNKDEATVEVNPKVSQIVPDS